MGGAPLLMMRSPRRSRKAGCERKPPSSVELLMLLERELVRTKRPSGAREIGRTRRGAYAGSAPPPSSWLRPPAPLA